MIRVGTIYLPSNITFLRKQNKLTQQQLADFFGYTHTAISNWESGNRSPDSIDLYKLSNIFEISVDDLVKVDLEKEYYNIKKHTKKEVKEKVTQIVSNSELEDNKKQMIINVVEVSCEE
jgi:transcriptional regulator with XRE-family HTH domain